MLSFMGDTLEGTLVEKPFRLPGELPLISDQQLKSSFGTGLHTVTPAHDINALRFSYAHNLSRDGIVCPLKGTLMHPLALQDLRPNDETLIEAIKDALPGQFYATWKHQQNEYRTKQDDEVVNLVTVDAWFVKLSEKLKYKCF